MAWACAHCRERHGTTLSRENSTPADFFVAKIVMSTLHTVRCPQCGKTVEWTPASAFRPFCSKRCKEIDLGAWASESYRIPVVDDENEDGTPTEERD